MIISHRRLDLVFVVCFLLSSCAHKNNIDQKNFIWQQQEARFYDIPIKMHAKPDFTYHDQQAGDDNRSTLIAYAVEGMLHDVQAYYMHQMEWHSWRHLTTVLGYEITLIFEKPQKLCIVSLRPAQSKNGVKVVISQGYR